MASINPINRLSGLARRLVQDGLLSEEEAMGALEESVAAGRLLISYVVDKGLVKPLDAAIAASQEYGVPLFDLAAVDPNHMPVGRMGPGSLGIGQKYHRCLQSLGLVHGGDDDLALVPLGVKAGIVGA